MTNSGDPFSRRRFLQALAAVSSSMALGCSERWTAFGEGETIRNDHWNRGDLAHLIPLVDHRRILIKASFNSPLERAPYLKVDDRLVAGQMNDTEGRFWQFYAKGLDAGRPYQLQIIGQGSEALTDPWPLKTFPHPQQQPQGLRILAFTCAGGNEALVEADGTRHFLELETRHRLMDRGLALKPDVVISNGDHIYWDQKTMVYRPPAFRKPWLDLYREYGSLDPALPVMGSANEAILKRIADPQIAALYGVRFRSTPVFMLTDDHDLFENDEAHADYISLPPEKDKLAAARATQYLYYPEFLPDNNRPGDLAGSSSPDREPGLSEVYGTLRYGQLMEALLYDTKRYSTINGNEATVVPDSTEHWLKQRTQAEDTAHLIHIPSTPIGWSAGKWGEWYPDVRQENGTLGRERAKPYWPPGWWAQHQRILEMLAKQKRRAPVIASGDLHAFAYGQINKSGDLNFTGNPVHSLCVGPMSTAGPGFPSVLRGIGAEIPSQLKVDEPFKPLEKNGFTLIDVTPDKMVFSMYAWRPPEPVEKIAALEPFFSYEITQST